MTKVYAWTKDNRKVEIRHKRPQRYMNGWDFKRALKYIEEELYWNDLEKDEIEVITFENEDEHWVQNIAKK